MCIDSTLHEVAGFTCCMFKQLAKIPIGRKEDARSLIEAGGCRESGVFYLLRQPCGMALRDVTKEPMRTLGQIFVHISMPRGSSGQIQMVCKHGADHAEFARTGDVDDI